MASTNNSTLFFKYLISICCCFYSTTITAQNNYQLKIQLSDKDNLEKNGEVKLSSLVLQTRFADSKSCNEYVYKLPAILSAKGYPAASVDSIFYSASTTHIILYLGPAYKLAEINTDSIDEKILVYTGWNKKKSTNKGIDFTTLQDEQQKILNYFETHGYPFAAVRLDNIIINQDKIKATLKVASGPLYHIDSIKIIGKIKIKNLLLQHYLGIENGSLYNKNKLESISKRLLELPYLQETQHWNLNMLGSGSILNLYLSTKRSSQVNFLVGFLPSSNGKSQLTADVNLDLKNALGAGETILLNWQQLQKQSPHLNLGYQHPYIFNSAFGIDLTFNLLKRDSSFLQINTQAGLQYMLSATNSGKIFLQNQKTYLLAGGYDTNTIKTTKQLPADIDVSASSIGIDYEWVNTNYNFNPRLGNEFRLVTAVGLKKIKKNNEITNLKSPTYNFNKLYDSIKLKTYQFRITVNGNHYFPIGKRATVKTGINAGFFESQNIFRNELFRIGGNKILRGFNEESIYASQYAVITAEYRYLTGTNSYLFGFTDAGVTKTKFQNTNLSNNFISAGLGLNFETKFGILNVSYAIGKRNDAKFDLREASKLHFGYINYF